MEIVVKDVRISVAMVSYNGEKYIGEQIETILEQLQENDELVISDDGSKDGTVALIQKYQQEDGRIRLLQGPGRGVKKNVEHVIKNTRGAYIFLADQDDIWVPDKVERVMEAFEKQKAVVVVHDAKVFAGENISHIMMESFFEFRNSGAGVLKNIIKNSYIGCCMAFRRELKEVILPIPGRIEMHDQWIGILGDYTAGKSYFLPEPLILYRRHEDNNSEMKHYGIVKMLRNRVVFSGYFFVKMLCVREKKKDFLGNSKKITVDK